MENHKERIREYDLAIDKAIKCLESVTLYMRMLMDSTGKYMGNELPKPDIDGTIKALSSLRTFRKGGK